MLKTMRNSFHHLKWTLFAVIARFHPRVRLLVGLGHGPEHGRPGRGRGRRRADHGRRVRPAVPGPGRALPPDVPGQLLARARARARPSPQRPRLDDRAHAPPRGGQAPGPPRLPTTSSRRRSWRCPSSRTTGSSSAARSTRRCFASNNIVPERFEEELREDMLLQKYAGLVKASVVVPDAELAREFSTRNDKATIEYILVPSGRLESNAQPTDADLQAYLDKHKDRYRAPVQRKVKYLLVDRARVRAEDDAQRGRRALPSTSGARTRLSVPEQVTPRTSSSRSSRTAAPDADAVAKAKAETIAARAKVPGADFAKLANENTDDPSGKAQRRPAAALLARPDGAGVRAGGLLHGARRDPRARQDAVRIPRHQARLEDAGAHAHVRRGAPSLVAEIDRTPGHGRGGPPRARARREAQGHAVGLRRRPPQAPDRQRSPSTRPSGARAATASTGIGANQKFADEAWTTAGRQGLRDPGHDPARHRLREAVRGARRGPAALRGAQAPPRLRVAGRAPPEGRPRAARAGREGALVRHDARRARDALRHRGQDDDRVRPRRPGARSSAPRPSSTAAVFQTTKGQAGPPSRCPTGSCSSACSRAPRATAARSRRRRNSCASRIRSREAERLTRAYLQQIRASRKVEVNEQLLASFMRDTAAGRRSSIAGPAATIGA